AMTKTFERLVVEIGVGDFDLVGVERIGIDGESMVVRGDLDFAGDFVEHRMICAAMAELQFVRLATNRDAENLVAEANPENWLAGDQLADLHGLMLKRLGITGAVRQEDAVGFQSQNVFCGRGSGNHREAAADLTKPAQNVVLDSEIVGDDVEPRL